MAHDNSAACQQAGDIYCELLPILTIPEDVPGRALSWPDVPHRPNELPPDNQGRSVHAHLWDRLKQEESGSPSSDGQVINPWETLE